MPTEAADATRLSLDEVYELAYSVLRDNGCDDANAAASASNMRDAEADGSASHGLFRLPGHVASLRSGKVNGTSRPAVTHRSPVVIDVDGDGGFAPIAHRVAIPVLAEAASQQGIALAGIRRTHHFGALWPEAQQIAERGLVAMVFVSSIPYVAPAGGTSPVFGTNPMAFGWPRSQQPPMVWDMASAAKARGEISIAAREGVPVELGVGLGPDGQPSTEPTIILEGAQLPFGGYKGSAIALMVDLMAGPLIGEVTSIEAGEVDNDDGGPSIGGETLIAIDPKMLATDIEPAGAEALFDQIVSQPGARLPGDRRLVNRTRSAVDGVMVPGSVLEECRSLLSTR